MPKFVKLDFSGLRDRGENKQSLKPPPGLSRSAISERTTHANYVCIYIYIYAPFTMWLQATSWTSFSIIFQQTYVTLNTMPHYQLQITNIQRSSTKQIHKNMCLLTCRLHLFSSEFWALVLPLLHPHLPISNGDISNLVLLGAPMTWHSAPLLVLLSTRCLKWIYINGKTRRRFGYRML